jgi:hypothetical protein
MICHAIPAHEDARLGWTEPIRSTDEVARMSATPPFLPVVHEVGIRVLEVRRAVNRQAMVEEPGIRDERLRRLILAGAAVDPPQFDSLHPLMTRRGLVKSVPELHALAWLAGSRWEPLRELINLANSTSMSRSVWGAVTRALRPGYRQSSQVVADLKVWV